MRHFILALLATALAAADPLIEHALAHDGAALHELRLAGPPGLQRVGAAYDTTSAPDDAAWDLLFDTIAAQRHARHSRLYWYTDLEQAKAAAAASGKPIVSLRLLGNLTDELSCANSRFFRALLYPDPAVSAWLRDNTILHWSSERPVPRVTIDFGDGRKIETTITGNSAHYIFDAEGRPIDVIPGLLAPQPFLASLVAAAEVHTRIAADPARRAELLRDWHAGRLAAIDSERAASGIALPPPPRAGRRPAAAQAMPIAVSKSAVEMPMLKAVGRADDDDVKAGAAWALAGQHWTARCELPAATIALLESTFSVARFGTVLQAGPLEQLRATLASDTARNAWDLHRRIHQWYTDGSVDDFVGLNRRVYRELFLTPTNDPWLGLRPEAFDGLAR